MKRSSCLLLASVFILAGVFAPARGETKNPDKRPRTAAIMTTAKDLGFKPAKNFENVYGIVADWYKDGASVSLYCLRDGTARIFSSSGVSANPKHNAAEVKKSADRCVRIADLFYDRSVPAADFAYPDVGKVTYYLLTYDGVRLCVGDMKKIKEGTDPTVALFNGIQAVYSALGAAK